MKILKQLFITIGVIVAFGIILMVVMKFKTIPVQKGSLEEQYYLKGSDIVTRIQISDGTEAPQYIIYYPKMLTEVTPLILWGNGSAALPKNYDELMRHLASWGFIVIDNYNSTTGTGQPLIDELMYMKAENENVESLFFGKIDMDNVAAIGHSQGSTGAINASTNFEAGALIKTVISVALPALKWCDPEDVYDTSKIKVPFLVLSGTWDFIVSPKKDCLEAIKGVDATIMSQLLIAKGAGHNEIQTDGGKYRGIITAWLRYHLMKDEVAADIFIGEAAEITTNIGWKK